MIHPHNPVTEDFRVKLRVQEQLDECKQRIDERLDKTRLDMPCPVISATSVDYEFSQRTHGIGCGGIGLIHQMVQRLELDEAINRALGIFKIRLPYAESDHVLSIAYNLLAGGTCLEHLELLRKNEVYLDALDARRIPDPTTAGDFCRRFTGMQIQRLMDVFNQTRLKVWQQQGKEFFEEALIDADGTMVETGGECKEGIDINHEGKWGYHPLLISLANTAEPLYIVNRTGSRPSHEGAAEYLSRAVELCRRAGFRRITLRGDTDFTQTGSLDAWDADGVQFIFGIDAMPKLYEIAENLPPTAWKRLVRPQRYEVQTAPRVRPDRVKERIVQQRGFENIKLVREYVAEFDYRPGKCRQAYRVVVVWKELEVRQGQQKLFDDSRCFFYITNDRTSSPEQIVRKANHRCNQENTAIEQLKNGVHALAAPLDSLLSNWAYMVIASLAWNLKIWAALLVPVRGRGAKVQRQVKQRLLRMEFPTFRQAWMQIPAQIVRSGRRIIYRLLCWNPWLSPFFRLFDALRTPLRC
jgi:hypothetical protein